MATSPASRQEASSLFLHDELTSSRPSLRVSHRPTISAVDRRILVSCGKAKHLSHKEERGRAMMH